MSISNLLWSRNTAEILSICGVRHACISPGSRNTPLTIGFIENAKIKCHSIIDERTNGFFALGIAKTSQTPVVIITTSGTATANLYPAIIEASLSRVPLIILTADRPQYLIGTGSNQTINQQDLYGHHVRGFIDIGLPNSVEQLLSILKKSYLISLGLNYSKKQINPPGPIHLNFPFAEPLINKNELSQTFEIETDIYDKLKIQQIKINDDYSLIPEELLNTMIDKNNILIICGEGLTENERNYLVDLAEKWEAPIFADSLSNIRFGYASNIILSHYNFYLNEFPIPDLIIRFGKKPISKLLNEYLDENIDKVILYDKIGRFNDDAKHVYSYSVMQIPLVSKQNTGNNYLNLLINLEIQFITKKYQKSYEQKELEIIKTCFENLPEFSNWFIGNSMPIRNVDNFVSTNSKNICVYGNRGASGIDGIISTALGMAILNPQKLNLLLIGDVSFSYDFGALQLAKQRKIPITIIVINNSGGQIFNKLDYSNYGIKDFEKYWITNPILDIKKIASLFGFDYLLIEKTKQIKNISIENQKLIEIKI
ncbi:MAG: 2-succinyl-5-enolpyruvyl-6-hydroxy-3-cyclohexene-1-carboxylic-acid synthase [Candidatus Marinimicrobia bacterium]|nr:2-succinyl-5-enolpyruvyl-6-hydroxy-3-cyclohexene-1-carboxylic-acid synthase [Candidatus Neomarinimicrobiota bacterium]